MTLKDRSSLLHAGLVLALAGAAFGAQAQTTSQAPATATTPTTEQIEGAFKRADANQDGKLSKEEAMRMPVLAEKFDQIDKDKDGFLSAEEFSAAVIGPK